MNDPDVREISMRELVRQLEEARAEIRALRLERDTALALVDDTLEALKIAAGK